MSNAHNPYHDKRWLILALIGIAQLMVVLDVTIVNVALPSAQQDLGFGDDSRQWIVTAYALAFGSLLLLGGRLGDLFGRKWTLIAGLLGFATASAIGGAAGSFGVLVAARAAQGVFGALLAPSALALLSTTFTDPQERSKAFGVFGAIVGSGAAIGLLLGGILTEWLSWRWALYVNLGFAIPAAVMALRLLVAEPRHGRPRLDLPGTLTASTGLFALVYGFSNAEMHSWGAPLTIGLLAAAAVLLSSFVVIESRAANPLLPLRVVWHRARGGSYLSVAVLSISIFSAFLFLTYFLQRGKGFSAIEAGLAFLPLSAVVIVTAAAVNTVLLPRVGPRRLLVVGLTLAGGAMLWLAQLEPSSSYAAAVLPPLLVLGLGMGNVFPPAIATATYGVQRRDSGVASAMVNTMQQVGGSVGLALLSTISASATSSYLEGNRPTPQLMAEAAVHGFTTAFYVAGGVLLGGALIVGAVMPRVKVSAEAMREVPAH